jgi:hypothetical protein
VDAASIERRLSELLASLADRLQDLDLVHLQDLVRHGESGIALENLCTQLDEYDASITQLELAEIVALGSVMRIDPSYWKDLRVRD